MKNGEEDYWTPYRKFIVDKNTYAKITNYSHIPHDTDVYKGLKNKMSNVKESDLNFKPTGIQAIRLWIMTTAWFSIVMEEIFSLEDKLV